MRTGGKLLARILQDLAGKVRPGITPKELSADAAEQIKKHQMQPVVLGYEGFPDVICISVNDAIVHGIPGSQPIRQGDLVKLDLTLGYKGMINDSAVTVLAGGHGSAGVQRLLDGTKAALNAGIAAIKGEGTRVGDISAAIQDVLEKEYHLGVIRELVGHGVGYAIHEAPNVPNYGVAGTGPVLHQGMTIAIEPMASLGDWHIAHAKDKNTIIMKDGSLGAHFEHTVLITEDSCEILTLPK
ncbi:type I methionyl aminopeptidase [Candidatus Saccharibacteria bacterium]|nr:type I methionyl aminopeptidase [Candidatus Saccharibacteria bacterium]